MNYKPKVYQGHSQNLAGGSKNYFFRFGNIHAAKRHAAHIEFKRFAKGVWGHAPRKKIFKWCNLVR